MFIQKDNPANHKAYLPYGYRKKTVFVSKVIAPYTKTVSSDWSGGSRSAYVVYRAATPTKPEIVGGSSWGSSLLPSVTLQKGDVLVQSGVFMGKPSTAHIYYCE